MPNDNETVEVTDLPELDVRTVVIMWADGDVRPKVTFSGCSVFEAESLARTGAQRLQERCRLEMDMDNDPDDEEDEDDDGYDY